MMGRTSTVYLLCFSRPLAHAHHYLGSTADLESRLEEHRKGSGARLMEVCKEQGIGFQLARTWEGGQELERQLKKRKNGPRLCPICRDQQTLDQVFGDQPVTTLLQRSPGIEVGPDGFDPAVYNGHLTLTSPATGRELRFLISTRQRGDWKGRRLVTLNEDDGHGGTKSNTFAEVTDFGAVRVFRKYQDDTSRPWQDYADLLNRAGYWAGRGVGYRIEVRCRRCNRLLTVESSRATGVGPDCARKLGL
jgi:predicted GIY-YIG superfamily endonuclease